ncbi:MAG TPA: hypothetical protein VMZ30_11755 [Pyrinomonadaceae bacterium]|nr:hypothetical protein [Pyrinomonadaceae bacterium]
MKRSAQKSKTLSLVQTGVRRDDSEADTRSEILQESFESWLNSVAPSLLQTPVAQTRRDNADPWRISLTSSDVTWVNRATVRESSDHRHWPPEVVMSFLAAEVIKRGK